MYSTGRSRSLTAILVRLAAVIASPVAAAEPDSRPDVLFIAIDDLNDWIGCLGGHPQAKTPNIDRLASRGVLFTNAHCAAPLCGPSRAAVFSGLEPHQTGLYRNGQNVRKTVPDARLLPRVFARAGYHTLGTGKLLHGGASKGLFDEDFFPEQRWSPLTRKQVEYTPDELPSKGTRPRHVIRIGPGGAEIVIPFNRMPSDRAPREPKGESFDWGPVDVADSDMGDGKITDWAIDRLTRQRHEPIFLAVGYYRPHIPLYAPRQYFDLHDEATVKLPAVEPKDLDDLGSTARKWALEPVTAGSHSTVLKFGQWRAATRAYLASVSFVDAQIGRLLAALEKSGRAERTVIVVWSDHGWHLGEKQHWGKWVGWRDSTRVPLIVVPPASADIADFAGGRRCEQPVGLIDIYPTLLDLCGIPQTSGLAGESLRPLLDRPNAATGRRVVTTFDEGNHSLTGESWHYIRYRDGSEELYDFQDDPHEWRNRARDASQRAKIADMSRQLDALLDPASLRSAARDLRRTVAHRGASLERPECTLASLRRAIELGPTATEMDVRTSKDGVLFLLHDETLDRTTDGSGRASERTMKELKALDAGSWFAERFADERIPTLREALELCRGKIDVLLDLKETGDVYARAIVEEVKRHGDPARTIIGVRSVEQAQLFRRQFPDASQLGLIPDPQSIEAFAAAGVETIRLWPRWLDPDGGELVRRVRDAGAALHLNGTSGRIEELALLLRHRPGSVSSDDPARLVKSLETIRQRP